MRYPDLSGAKLIALDTETYDPHLQDLGPGQYRKDGSRLLGVSLSDGQGFSEYYNLGHYDCDKEERTNNVRYLRDVLGSDTPKLGQNIIYDIDWLENGEYKIKVNGPLASIETAEALLDETQLEYNLDFMSRKYLGHGKTKLKVQRFCDENRLKGDFRRWLWKMPYDMVREYAIGDADDPHKIFAVQRPMLVEQDMLDLFNLECELMRCLVLLRKTGVPIDQDKRDRNGLRVQNIIETREQALFERYGEFNYMSTQQLAAVFDREGIRYPYNVMYENPNGKVVELEAVYLDDLDKDRIRRANPTIAAAFFKRFEKELPFVKYVHRLRLAKHHLNTFIMGSHVRFVGEDGLMHPQFFNMRNDTLGALKGTRSGRLSGANPNLQQQPAKGVDEYWGQICREDFVPFPDCWWGKIDYSQIEYRFMAHFARGPGSEELRAAYNSNPDQDYHQFIMDLTGLKRRYAKNLNFGVAFGMGAKHMAELFGWSIEYAYEILNVYHARAPYIKATISDVESVAKRRGYIKTFLKRRSHLTNPSKAYTMYCRLVQGSAADLMKKSMVECFHAGVFDALPPHVTVHDELGVSVPKTKAGLDAFREMQHIMETCLKLRVPIKAEAELGRSWADVEEFDWTEKYKEVA